MIIEAKYLDISFDKAGVRNSQKRLKELIEELAITPLQAYHEQLRGDFELVEEILLKRIANVIAYWCQHKHDPVKPNLDALMNDITNARRDNGTLAGFYKDQVTNALHILAPQLNLDVPQAYHPPTDELEFALLELEEKFEHHGIREVTPRYDNHKNNNEVDEVIYNYEDYEDDDEDEGDYYSVAKIVTEKPHSSNGNGAHPINPPREKSITVTMPKDIQDAQPKQIEITVLNITAQVAWGMVYELMGFQSEYIQTKMLPRWQQAPDSFEKDRRFLYNLFIQTLKNASGTQIVAGNFSFSDQQMTVDNLWQYYLADLTQNVGPQLVVAKFDSTVNLNWYQRIWQIIRKNFQNFSMVWLIALVVALIFDGLTTYVSLEQTPMDGATVWIFTILITILFQIADLLVISYRKREFEADGMRAKYGAKAAQLSKMLENLDTTSDSYVQLIIERSQAHADWKAAEDNRKMSRRGRFWSARIADINIAVTAYGFAFMFLNSEEPMGAITRQIEAIVAQQWNQIDPWVFLMVGMAITVSFVINTAQRTEILGWSMRRMKNDM